MIDRTGQRIRFFHCPACKAEVSEHDEDCYICGFKMPKEEDEGFEIEPKEDEWNTH